LLDDGEVLADDLAVLEDDALAVALCCARLWRAVFVVLVALLVAAVAPVAARSLATARSLTFLGLEAVRTAFLGREEHAALTIGALATFMANASLNMLKPAKLNTVSAPSAAGLRISALTCATSLL
jgi:hypothetical protein